MSSLGVWIQGLILLYPTDALYTRFQHRINAVILQSQIRKPSTLNPETETSSTNSPKIL